MLNNEIIARFEGKGSITVPGESISIDPASVRLVVEGVKECVDSFPRFG